MSNIEQVRNDPYIQFSPDDFFVAKDAVAGLANFDPETSIRALRAITGQLENKEEAEKHFPDGVEPPVQTAFNHYFTRMFLWDTELVAEVIAGLGSKNLVDWAAYSLFMLTDNQRPDGFISNMQYLDHNEGLHLGGRAERWTFNGREGSDYTQPALLPQAINAVFEAYMKHGDEESAWNFLKDIYPRAKLHIEYFKNYRASGDDNSLVFNIHPHEDGRDSSGTGKFKLPRVGKGTVLEPLVDNVDVAQDIIGTFVLKNIRLKLAGWELEKARKIYGRRDVAFNALLAKNSLVLSGLSRKLAEHYPEDANTYHDDAEELKDYSESLEQDIYKYTWFEDAIWSEKTRSHSGAFFSLKGNGKKEKGIDLGDIMPVVLPNLNANQLESVLNLVLTSFNTPYALPSAPIDSRFYDPHNKRKTGCNWNGSTWPHMNKLIIDGLRLQAERLEADPNLRAQYEDELLRKQTQFLCNLAADMLAGNSRELTKEVYAEQYDPETGEAQRYPTVKNFGMAMQAEITPYFGLSQDESYYNLCRVLGRTVNIYKV